MPMFDIVYCVLGAYFAYMFYDVVRGIVNDHSKEIS